VSVIQAPGSLLPPPAHRTLDAVGARVRGAVGEQVRRAGGRLQGVLPSPPPAAKAPAIDATTIRASAAALRDVPSDYLARYVVAARECPKLTWQVLAGIGKVESDHGRSHAPGVRSGLNRAGCCAGPMQFNLTNGPPSTWDGFGRGGNPYDPGDAIPAAARKLCANGLAQPAAAARDPCPNVLGSAALHVALKRYNNACWYVHEVVTLAERYTGTASRADSAGGTATPRPAAGAAAGRAASPDPFVQALVHNPRITTTTGHGCDPVPDLASGELDLRVQSILAAMAERYRVRVSCLKTGHSRYVKGTTRVSNHTVWRAVDIDRVDGQPVNLTSSAAKGLIGWLDGLEGPLRPDEVGSPFAVGHAPYFTDEGHQEHVHIGYSARLP
jgi:hypothetical protein